MRRTAWVLVGLVLLAGCGGSGDDDASVDGPSSAPSALPGPQVTAKGAEPLTLTATWRENEACVFLDAGYGSLSPNFPRGWTFDAASKTVRAADGSARGRIGQKVTLKAVSLDALPKGQELCASAAIQVLSATVVK